MISSNFQLVLGDVELVKYLCYLKRYNDFLGFSKKTDEGIILFALHKLDEYFQSVDNSLIADGWIGDSSNCADCIDNYT